jgi:hypothetical protein
MKRRFFALLAVPALALGFAFASPGTDQAQAYPINPALFDIAACSIADALYANAYDQGDVTTEEQIYAMTKDWPC